MPKREIDFIVEEVFKNKELSKRKEQLEKLFIKIIKKTEEAEFRE